MKKLTFIFFCICLVLSSCGQPTYDLDFSKFKLTSTIDLKDSSLQTDDRLHETTKAFGIEFTTSKTSYTSGETVKVTLQNNDSYPVYLSPPERDDQFFSLFEPTKEELEFSLICKKPAISGQVIPKNNDYYILHIQELPSVFLEKHGYQAGHLSIQPGKTLTFRIKMPPGKGTFRFFMQRFDHSKGIGYWGTNKFILSNSFTVQ